ncbi:MAG: phosphoribosylanthranilate isomerase [Streptococcaceae bacterium]|jgi:phosphoribosylanthranilate isomerase|nr:phosphoribosylanthranilate isomerase [Streptococcaceae bacterium]
MWIKICGLATQPAVEAAVKHGATHIGFVFAPSQRQITPEAAKYLASFVPESVQKVGLFVNADLLTIEQTIATVGLDMVQLHGQETAAFADQISVPVMKAFGIKDGQLPPELAAFKQHMILLDAPPTEFAGGSGKIFDWGKVDLTALADYDFFIAGGLTPDNVAEAITIFQPTGVDVSSGVETDGVKDLEKIKLFIEKSKR